MTADISNEVIDSDAQREISDHRRVIRNIIKLIREVQRYESDCEIISLPEIRDHLKKELVKTLQHYES